MFARSAQEQGLAILHCNATESDSLQLPYIYAALVHAPPLYDLSRASSGLSNV